MSGSALLVFFSGLLWENYRPNYLLFFAKISGHLIILVPSEWTCLWFSIPMSPHIEKKIGLTAAACRIQSPSAHISAPSPDIKHFLSCKTKSGCSHIFCNYYFIACSNCCWSFGSPASGIRDTLALVSLLGKPRFQHQLIYSSACPTSWTPHCEPNMIIWPHDHVAQTSRFVENTSQ